MEQIYTVESEGGNFYTGKAVFPITGTSIPVILTECTLNKHTNNPIYIGDATIKICAFFEERN